MLEALLRRLDRLTDALEAQTVAISLLAQSNERMADELGATVADDPDDDRERDLDGRPL